MTLLYVMLAKGDVTGDVTIIDIWQHSAIAGNKKLLEGSYTEACLLFQKAQKIQGDMSFDDYLCNYLYVLSLMLDNSTDSKIMMIDIAQEPSYRMKQCVLSLKILVVYQKDKKHNVDDVVLRKFCETAVISQLQGMMFMALIQSRAMKRNHGINTPRRMMPQMRIFKQECSIFYPVHEEGSPSLSLISCAMPDLTISSAQASPIVNQISHSTSTTSVASIQTKTSVSSNCSWPTYTQPAVAAPQVSHEADNSQLVYVIRQDAKIYPFLRTEGANGSLGTFREIPYPDYQYGWIGTRNVTNEDRQLWQLWRTSGYTFPLAHILPRLNNIGKFFTLISGKTSPAKAAFFTPYVEVEAEEDGFRVNSNISREDITRADNIIC